METIDQKFDIEKIHPELGKVSRKPDRFTDQEKDYLEGEKKRALLIGLVQDIGQRKAFGNKIYCLVVFWVIGILALLASQGFGAFGFNLSEKVLITLIGGTTLNVLGIFVIVARYFFRESKEGR